MHCETRDPVISSSSLQGPHEHGAAKHNRPTHKPPCLLVQRGDHHLYGGFAPCCLPALCSCCKNPTALICTWAQEQRKAGWRPSISGVQAEGCNQWGNIPAAKLYPSGRWHRSQKAADLLLTPPHPQKVSGVCPAQIRPAVRSTPCCAAPVPRSL